MKTTSTGAKAPPQFEPHIVEEFRSAVAERREILGRKMAALMPLKDDIQAARANGWKYSDIAYKLSKGIVSVDSTTVARFCHDHLGEKKRKGKGGGSGVTSSTAPAVTTSAAATSATSKPKVEVP